MVEWRSPKPQTLVRIQLGLQITIKPMKKHKHIILTFAALLCGSLLLASCCSRKPDIRGYDFESVVKKDYADMIDTYGNGAKMYIACGQLNYTYEEIVEHGMSLDSIYFASMFTVFQVGDTVVEIMHGSGIDEPVVNKKAGQWQECQPITPETEITAMEALELFLASGDATDTVCRPMGNNVVLRLPYTIENSKYCYLFGYDSVFTVLDEHGTFIRCSE